MHKCNMSMSQLCLNTCEEGWKSQNVSNPCTLLNMKTLSIFIRRRQKAYFTFLRALNIIQKDSPGILCVENGQLNNKTIISGLKLKDKLQAKRCMCSKKLLLTGPYLPEGKFSHVQRRNREDNVFQF